MIVLDKKLNQILLLTLVLGAFAVPVYSQNWQRVNNRQRTNYNNKSSIPRAGNRQVQRSNSVRQGYNTNNPINTAINGRGSVSYPTQPATETSFYPTIRTDITEPYPNNNYQSGWAELGNGAIIRQGNNLSNSYNQQENKLSPEVLETIRQLKAEYAEPEAMYQMAPVQTQAPNPEPQPKTAITPKKSNSLIAPNSDKSAKNNQTGKDIQRSSISFPPNKNIKIKSLDFRQTDVADALRSLARIININLMLGNGVSGKTVTVLFNDVTMEEAFNTLLVNFDLSFSWEGKILRIFPSNEAPTFTRIFSIQHTNAVEIQPMIARLMSEKGKSELDSRTNSIIVTDTLAKLTEIENMLPQIDVQETGLEITSRPVTEVFYLNYADASTITEAIQMLSEGAKIKEFSSSAASQAGAAGGTTTGRMDMMIITDTLTNLDRIRELIDKLDVPPIQVTIDAHIYEIDKNKEEQMGVNWQKNIPVAGMTESNLFTATIAPMSDTAGGTGVFRFGSLDVNQFTAVLSMLNTGSFAKVLSNPVITTLNNRSANITVGQAISYISASTVSEGGQVSNEVSQANANISLDVTPSVTGNDEVFLDITPNISSVLGYTTLGGNSTPNLSNRSAKTQVICKNNHTIVIGGMIKTDKNESVNKVPILGNLPGIGKLFQSRTTKESRTELIIFITPHIVKEKVAKHNSSVLNATPRLSLNR
ncbi:MAG: type II secretion system protein GspD [Candidatus Riflebacteria bacterium]|nr:type II secretion system protein GspD [Candidatus Riflebacteria bacterium]